MKTTDDHSYIEEWIEGQPDTGSRPDISVVIPAYNEEWRLPPTLLDVVDYFDRRGTSYQVIVVDDGSSDNTAGVVKKFERIRDNVRLIRLPKNRGKGHAVRTGALNSHGKLILFTDADGSTPIKEFERLEAAINQQKGIAIGSRAMQSEDTTVSTRWHRKILGRCFNFCVNNILLPGIADTQCGFKMFTAETARFLFELQQSDRWSFDIEILFIARKVGLEIAEVPINWTNVPGSKVNLVLDAMKMFRDIFIFKLRHAALSPKTWQEFHAKWQEREPLASSN